MELADVSRVALALDGVCESSVRGRLRWSLRGRLVARELDDSSIVVRCGFAEREELLAAFPTTFFVPPRFDAHMMVVTRLDGDPDAIVASIHAAWRLQSSAG